MRWEAKPGSQFLCQSVLCRVSSCRVRLVWSSLSCQITAASCTIAASRLATAAAYVLYIDKHGAAALATGCLPRASSEISPKSRLAMLLVKCRTCDLKALPGSKSPSASYMIADTSHLRYYTTWRWDELSRALNQLVSSARYLVRVCTLSWKPVSWREPTPTRCETLEVDIELHILRSV